MEGCSLQIENIYVERRRGKVLLRAGHQYIVKKKYNTTGFVIWECTNRKKHKCRGLLRMKDEKIIEERPHQCIADFARNECAQFLQNIKDNITTPEFPAVPTSYNKAIANAQESGVDHVEQIPQFNNVKSTLYRYRNNAAEVKKIHCTEATEFEVPPRYQKFLLADYECDGLRIIIFCSETSRKIMKLVKDFFSDGTFKSCPSAFKELYVIHGDLGSDASATNIVPLAYCLINKMTFKAYVTLFNLIKAQIPEWDPLHFKTDFENAAIKAIRKVFPNAIVSGCYYHYNKSIWKKGKELGLLKSDEKDKKREVELSAVLALLPETEVLNGWAYITRKNTQDPQIQKFRSYMELQWLKPDYVKLISVFAQRHRTNNFLEGWHNKLNKAMQVKHPNVMHLLNIIQEDAALVSVKNKLIQSDKMFKKRQKKAICNDEFIQEAQLELLDGQITVGHFLEMMRS